MVAGGVSPTRARFAPGCCLDLDGWAPTAYVFELFGCATDCRSVALRMTPETMLCKVFTHGNTWWPCWSRPVINAVLQIRWACWFPSAIIAFLSLKIDAYVARFQNKYAHSSAGGVMLVSIRNSRICLSKQVRAPERGRGVLHVPGSRRHWKDAPGAPPLVHLLLLY